MSSDTKLVLPDLSDATIVSLLESIFLGPPKSIKSMKVTAAFHAIYVLTYHPNIDYILRVAGNHVPSIKTENEAAILMWLKGNTNVPVPDVIAFDSTTNNILGQEYIILSRCPGVAISDIYDSLTAHQLDLIVLQLIDILSELHQHSFSQIGGLRFSPESEKRKEIIPGPVLDEHFWFIHDIQKYFPSETFDSVNYHGPFDTYTEYATSAIKSYLHVTELHSALKDHLTPFLPRLSAFLDLLAEHASVVNQTEIRLAHKDLHFANVLYIPETGKISAIIDWEFAGTVPSPQWDPVRAFLWNAQPGQDSFEEKYRLRSRFVELCQEKDARFIADAEFTSTYQQAMHLVRNSLRGITTSIPRNLHSDAVQNWTKDLEKGLTVFGV
ncbi:hypothetical protein BP5796_09969 [Coleophoma crateriformis]|uniref:Aminoglycoside phosphotransferase domain-containing protein n=1 Tax=Coleophoma crateriformis TaxID=565419 RepID=A0A3D8QU27_9HELO|nr:hypothetical protein BP5796_09969 [Coleophoma crateriformis]